LKGYRIRIYGITDTNQQDRIVQLIKEHAVKNAWKPIYVCFVEKKVLVQERGGYRRGDEKVLYAVVVK